ncbi:type IV pilin protein [Roseateles sp. BYS180W]|uniref:Type IV pilin protein n=1 Tax=Roseateles rivi TaxID=3299028 RepID=A0ABW7FY45_9BURK
MSTRRTSYPLPQQMRGLSLIELIVVLCIVGILALVAQPVWTQQVHKSRRTDALSSLAQVQLAQERWRSLNPSYSAELGAQGLGLGTSSAHGHYTLTLELIEGGYRVSANAQGAQAKDRPCQIIRLEVQHAHTRYLAQDEQGRDSAASCWPQ